MKYSQTITFPSKVIEADGGTVEGTKVSFNDNDQHEVRGKDKASKSAAGAKDGGSSPVWVWRLVGTLSVAVMGGVVAALVMSQRKKNQPQFVPYAAPAQVYDPNQALFGQQGQPMQQPYQQGQPYQPGYTDPTTQPYQQGQPYQQPYNNQPGQGF